MQDEDGYPSGSRFRDPALTAVDAAEHALGVPVRRASPLLYLRPREAHGFGRGRFAEIVMILPRPGGVLFHTKAFYPAGTLRLPTGGVHRGEPVLDAAARELREETGLILAPRRFLFHQVRRLDRGGTARDFHSLGILYPESDAQLVPEDAGEEITELRAVPWEGIEEIVRALESLDGGWRAWGRFRAAPHRLLLDVRREHPDWFVAGR